MGVSWKSQGGGFQPNLWRCKSKLLIVQGIVFSKIKIFYKERSYKIKKKHFVGAPLKR